MVQNWVQQWLIIRWSHDQSVVEQVTTTMWVCATIGNSPQYMTTWRWLNIGFWTTWWSALMVFARFCTFSFPNQFPQLPGSKRQWLILIGFAQAAVVASRPSYSVIRNYLDQLIFDINPNFFLVTSIFLLVNPNLQVIHLIARWARGALARQESFWWGSGKKKMFITQYMSFMDIYSGIHFSDMDFESRNDFDNEILCYRFKT